MKNISLINHLNFFEKKNKNFFFSFFKSPIEFKINNYISYFSNSFVNKSNVADVYVLYHILLQYWLKTKRQDYIENSKIEIIYKDFTKFIEEKPSFIFSTSKNQEERDLCKQLKFYTVDMFDLKSFISSFVHRI